jgi:Ca-activated chloride channel family protein
MKIRTVALLSLAGMLLSSAVGWSFGLPAHAASVNANVAPSVPEQAVGDVGTDDPTLASFETGTTLRLGGRVGHARLAPGSTGTTYVLLEAKTGDVDRATTPAPSHLALVIDRSGSMRGERLRNAIAGANVAVDHLGEGDVVSVIAFDSRPSRVVPATTITAGNREQIKSAIRGIVVGGETCISCGIDDAIRELSGTTGKVERMIVLSDGEATAGVRDLVGFRSLAAHAREKGVSVTTIGVGTSYNQKILGAIAQEAGGGHYFIENPATTERAFQAEADSLRATVAVAAEATIELAAGVELVRVFDRPFQKQGNRVVVPLGSFTKDDTQTVLIEVRVPTGAPGSAKVASVELAYRDLVRSEDAKTRGTLAIEIGAGESELDPIVSGRIQRSQTAAAVLGANDLFQQGKFEEAQQKLQAAQQALTAASAIAKKTPAPAGRSASLYKDFEGQAGVLSAASDGLRKDKAAPDTDRSLRRNQEVANPYMR